MATYPSNILVKGNVQNEVHDVDENDHNILKEEIIALQTYVGTNPHGSQSSLADRMYVCIGTDGALRQGSTEPTNPLTGQVDRDWET